MPTFFLYMFFHFLFIGFQTVDHITLWDEIYLLVILSDPWLSIPPGPNKDTVQSIVKENATLIDGP